LEEKMAVSDLKVGTRMSFGFGLILILMISTMVITFWSLGKVEHNTNFLNDESLPFTLLADRMTVNALQVQQFATDASATKDLSVLQESEAHYKEFLKGAQEFRAMFVEENATAELRAVDGMIAAMEEMYDTAERMTLAYVNDGQEAGDTVMAEFDADTSTLTGMVAQLRETQVEEMHGQVANILPPLRKSKRCS
jgi:methyl-accepting chemotaxis protein